MKNLILTLAALFSIAFTPFASAQVIPTTTTTTQTAPAFPSSLPVGSLGKLRAYALAAVTNGYSSVYSQSMRMENAATTIVAASGSSPKAIIATLSSASFSFKVANPNDGCSTWTQLSDANGQTLFYGGSGFYLEKVSTNNYKIPASAAVKLELSYTVPIYVGNVDSATIIFRDSSGGIQWTDNVKAYNGYIYFQQAYAGRNGEVILNGGGFTAAYSLNSGVQIPDINVRGAAVASLENYQEVNDIGLTAQAMTVPTVIDISTTNWQQAPVVRLEIASLRNVTFTTKVVKNGTVVEYAQSVSVHIAGQDGEVSAQCVQGSASFTLSPGVYWISVNDLATLQRYQPQSPYQGGGQG